MLCNSLEVALSSELVLHAQDSNTLHQLLLNGADINYQSKAGWCLLFELISLNLHQNIIDLQSHSLNIHVKDDKGRSALFWAIHYGHTDVIKALISLDYNLKFNVTKDLPALHYAIYKNNLHVVKLLLDAGLDIDKRDPYDNTALDYAKHYQYNQMVSILKNRHLRTA